MEQIEDGKEDHNLLARLCGDETHIDPAVESKLTEFVHHAFDHIEGKEISVGKFLGVEPAQAHVLVCKDSL